ncbi:hypothetical protein [Piscinibacter gummiphilus]|uniref:Uncharacterized protein n=1 Tax=Piscinibacter gummiphilus TaxID=946333 RepID=A0ABZ0CZF3_9BURK|nr:hypothetical protein [Piscinibacter gummiphilus]WOB08546.1 hypothetical protein RXV79_00500 [Piscinibacter gummiphilus]
MSGQDEARDPHLREALRHAPDAQLQAPPQLSELILKEARAKARDPKHADIPAPGWARSVWAWLARPAVATGFAGVMAATLVGLMWWDEPMDQAAPRSPLPAAAPKHEKPAAAEAPFIERTQPAEKATAPVPKPEPVRKKADAPREKRAEPNASEAAAGTARPASLPAPDPMAAAVPTPAAAPPALSADTSSNAQLAKARTREEEPKRERSSMAPAEAQRRRAAAKAQLNESRLQAEGEAYSRVASVRAAMAAEPTRWTWQRDNSDARPLNEALYAWLAQLDAATMARWQPVDATAQRPGREIRLLLDGDVQHSFRITHSGVLWQRRQGIWQFSTLASTDLTALEGNLP